MNGFLLIDKEKGGSSFSVVKAVRNLTGEKKVGHAGTLDPLATGLMLVAVGEGTKLLEYFLGLDKEYEVVARFGAVSDSYDADGNVSDLGFSGELTKEDIETAIEKNFLGEIEQLPPKYSALKVKGRRACDIMREGGDVDLKARKVKIYKFELISGDWPEYKFRVSCGSGTYIRSLIHDLGQVLGVGGYVLELRRTKLGNFSVENASDERVYSLEEFLSDFDVLELSDEDFLGLEDGRTLLGKKFDHEGPVMALYNGKLTGVLEGSSEGDGIKYKKRIFS